MCTIPPLGFRGCRSHRAKAFLAPKVPYRPRNAKIKVYYPRPICIALRKGVGKILSTNVLYPSRVFGGADPFLPQHVRVGTRGETPGLQIIWISIAT